jgi:hypothetical protein
MSFGYGTRITTPGGDVAIERISACDQVLVGRLESNIPIWMPATVQFSDGDMQGSRSMSALSFEAGERLVCTPGQPLLSADGRVVRADRLRPGDQLLAPDGTPRTIAANMVVKWTRGLHGVAAGSWTGSPDGHFIAAGGVVAGDWLLEVNLPRDLQDLN